MTVTRFFAVGIMTLTFSLMLTAGSPAFGCTNLPAAQPWITKFDAEIAEAVRMVAGCSNANWQNCIQADRHLDYAERAIHEIHGVCIDKQRGDCLLGKMRTEQMNQMIARLRSVDKDLVARSSMSRDRAGYVDMVLNSWSDTPQCTEPQPPFAITGVVHEADVQMGKRTDLHVFWTGRPAFPLTMIYFNKGNCPAPYSCQNPTSVFSVFANPLVFPGALGCDKIEQAGNYYFDYAVVLEDAAGNRTQEVAAGFTCTSQDARCEEYARTAVEQSKKAMDANCPGIQGPRWESTYKDHYGWCITASPAFADAEAKAREDALKKCISSSPPVQRSCTFNTSNMAGDEIWCDAYMECHDTECKVTTMHIVNIAHIKGGFKAPGRWLYSGYNSCEGTLRHYRIAAGCR